VVDKDRPIRPSQAGPGSATEVTAGTTVYEVALAYIRHAEEYYRSNPKEVEKIKLSVRPLRQLYGRTPAATFDSLALEAVQAAMIEAGLARSTINKRVRVLKRLFKWAARRKMSPASVYGELLTIEGLKRGRSKARETEPVTPVPQEHIDAVLPLVNRHVRAMILLELLCGARPGEICIMRRADIDTSGRVWLYRPRKHKNLWRGHNRQIFLGPQAQEIVKEFLRPDLDAYLFSPWLAREERYQALRAKRQSKVPPSQHCRRKANPKKLPGQRYTTYSYRQAIRNACEEVASDQILTLSPASQTHPPAYREALCSPFNGASVAAPRDPRRPSGVPPHRRCMAHLDRSISAVLRPTVDS
jgi:integrase